MAIRQRGSKWQIDVTVGGTRKSATADTQEEAQVIEAKLRLDMLTNSSPKPSLSGWTLADAYDRCYSQVWQGTPHGANVSKIAPKLLAHFGKDTPLAAITTADIDAYCEAMRKRSRANATINRHMAVLSKLYSYAMERREVSHVHTKPHIEHYRESEGRTRFFTLTEEQAITKHMRQLGYNEQADFVEFLIDTGARVESDAFSLTWDNVDIQAGLVVFKNRKARNTTGIPMTPRVKAMLTARAASPAKAIHVWPYKYWWIRGPWARTQTALGKDGDSEWIPHTCRHTTASRLVQRGVPLRAVQDFMGHKTLSQTQRYSHLAPAALLPCAAALADYTTDSNPPKSATG
jgi:site-specific recombinase XerD